MERIIYRKNKCYEKIFGFKVLLNNIIVCRAGFKNENAVVTCILDSIRREDDNSEKLNINIGGLNAETSQHVDWYKNSLQEGDKITIEIITDNFDTPISIRESKVNKDLIARKIEYFYKLKEELKDHLGA